jgi:hypothetical protein
MKKDLFWLPVSVHVWLAVLFLGLLRHSMTAGSIAVAPHHGGQETETKRDREQNTLKGQIPVTYFLQIGHTSV